MAPQAPMPSPVPMSSPPPLSSPGDDVEDIDDLDDVEDIDGLTPAELRKRRKGRKEAREAARLARLKNRVTVQKTTQDEDIAVVAESRLLKRRRELKEAAKAKAAPRSSRVAAAARPAKAGSAPPVEMIVGRRKKPSVEGLELEMTVQGPAPSPTSADDVEVAEGEAVLDITEEGRKSRREADRKKRQQRKKARQQARNEQNGANGEKKVKKKRRAENGVHGKESKPKKPKVELQGKWIEYDTETKVVAKGVIVRSKDSVTARFPGRPWSPAVGTIDGKILSMFGMTGKWGANVITWSNDIKWRRVKEKQKAEATEPGEDGAAKAKRKGKKRKGMEVGIRLNALPSCTDDKDKPTLPLALLNQVQAFEQMNALADESDDSESESDEEEEAEGESSDLSSSVSSTSCSTSLSSSTSSHSSAMRVARELAEGSAPLFNWERSFQAKPLEEQNLLQTKTTAGMGIGIGKASTPEVESFLLASMVDPDAAQRLRDAPPVVQQAVCERGAILGVKNPSSVLIARIRDAELGRLEDTPLRGDKLCINMFMKCDDPRIEDLVGKFKLDMRAAGLLRQLPKEERDKAFDLPLHEAKNPSQMIIMQLSGKGSKLNTNGWTQDSREEFANFGGAGVRGIGNSDGFL